MKPVGYFLYDQQAEEWEEAHAGGHAIPLYKLKQLSDEEIWEVINRTAWVGTEEEIRFKIANAIIKEITE